MNSRFYRTILVTARVSNVTTSYSYPRKDSPHDQRQHHAEQDENPARIGCGGVQFHAICEGSRGLQGNPDSKSSGLGAASPRIGLEPTSRTPVKLHDNLFLDVNGLVVGKGEQVDGHARGNHLLDGGHDRVPCNLGTGDDAVYDDRQVEHTHLFEGLVS